MFSASGTFENGTSLSGVITIDTATGLVVSGDLAVSGSPADFTAMELQRTWPPSSPFLSEVELGNGQATNNLLILLFPPVSLVGYSGGVLCGVSPAVCQDATLTYRSNISTESNGFSSNFIALTEGGLSPARAPEPAPGALALDAIALMVLCRRGFA